MVGQVVSEEQRTRSKDSTNKEQHVCYGSEETMPAFLILYPCTRAVTSDHPHVRTYMHLPTQQTHSLTYRSCRTKQRKPYNRLTERAYGCLGAPKMGNSCRRAMGLASW